MLLDHIEELLNPKSYFSCLDTWLLTISHKHPCLTSCKNTDSRRHTSDAESEGIPRNKPSHHQFRPPANTAAPSHLINTGSKTGQDLITALLNRGTKLRDAMVVSEVVRHPARDAGNVDDEVGKPAGKGKLRYFCVFIP